MTGRKDLAAHAWITMRTLIFDKYDRRPEVSDALQLSYIRAKALRQLASRGPLTMRALAREIGSDAPYTTVVVDELERRGLVGRVTSPEDRRMKVVTLTAAGAEYAGRADAILNEPPEVLRRLSADDLAALDRILTALAED